MGNPKNKRHNRGGLPAGYLLGNFKPIHGAVVFHNIGIATMLWKYASPKLFASQLLLICTLLSKSMAMLYIGSIPASLDFTIYCQICQICQIPIVSKLSSFAPVCSLLQAYSHFFIYTESSLVEQSTPRSHLIFDAQVGLGDGKGWLLAVSGLRNPWISIDG